MRCITAICPAGPPKLSAATRAQTRKAAAKLMPWPVGQGPRDSFPRGPLAAEDREQIVEQPGASRQALLLLRRIGADPRDQHLQARRLLAGELAVLEIDVVDDLGDLAETRLLEPAPRQQHLEAAAVALMGELGGEHVEAQLARLRLIAPGWHEFELRLRVDEAPDQPSARNAVHMDALAGHPHTAAEIRGSLAGGGRPSGGLRHLLLQPGFDPGDETIDALAPLGAEEVDGNDLGLAFLQPGELGLDLTSLFLCHPATQSLGESLDVLGEGGIVLVPRRIEERAHFSIRKPVDEPRLADQGFAAFRQDLLQQPVEILLALLAGGERIDRVLDCDRAQGLEPAPDLDAEIGGLGRELVDQEQPALRQGCDPCLLRAHGGKRITFFHECNSCIFNETGVTLALHDDQRGGPWLMKSAPCRSSRTGSRASPSGCSQAITRTTMAAPSGA